MAGDEDEKIIDELAEEIIWASNDVLNMKQEKFCQLFSSDQNLYGNWVQTYIEVYKPKKDSANWYKNACSAASQILSNTKVVNRINDLLDANWLNEVEVAKQHRFLITQYNDLWVKHRAIDSFYKLHWKFVQKVEHSWAIDTGDLKGVSTEELRAMKAARLQAKQEKEEKDWQDSEKD